MDRPSTRDTAALHRVLSRIGRAPLVGRDDELAALRAELGDASGAPRAVLLSGESGIGKSRLLAEASRLAEQAGWCVLRGGADEEVGAFPYLPWIEALRAHLAGGPDEPAGRAPGAGAADLAPLLPELAARGDPGVAPPASLTAEQQRLRLFGAVVALLERIARRAPLLLVLDDVQWFDVAGAELL